MDLWFFYILIVWFNILVKYFDWHSSSSYSGHRKNPDFKYEDLFLFKLCLLYRLIIQNIDS